MTGALNEHPTITVSDFVSRAPARLEVEILAGLSGASTHLITIPRIQKLGLALAGFTRYIHAGRLQIVGQSEIRYLGQLETKKRSAAIENLEPANISCILVTKSLDPPPELIDACNASSLPLLRTPLISSEAIEVVTSFLQQSLAPVATRNGVLLDVYGMGVLLEGASGIGKSESALDLVTRGHRLVSDDVIEVRCVSTERLIGSAPELLREHLEIRGLGIINIRDLFGVSAITNSKTIELSIKLVKWEETLEVDRLGIDPQSVQILGVRVPQVVLPVSPGRNLATLIETACRVQLLRSRGYDGAQAFVARHLEMLANKGAGLPAETKGDGNSHSG
ncbi:MAG: HPr kinase/phosphorylase [Blastocatellia bacterium]|nr:HPr kinase/phosphorylase [Blastocatellia bacterium]